MEARTLLCEKLFRHVGLSMYEAKIYMSLTVEGPSEARRLSMTSGVPRTKVYGTLKKLIERGLVVEAPGNPRKFAIISPAEAFGSYLESSKTSLSEGVTSLVEFENTLSALEGIYQQRQWRTNLEPQKGEIWLIQGRPEVMQRTGEMLRRAKESIDVVTTESGLILFYKMFNKQLDKLVENGVRVRIRTPIGSTNGRLAKELDYAYEVKHVDIGAPILFLCVDERELLLVEPKPDDFNSDSSEDFGMFSEDPTLCTFFSSLLISPTGKQD
jgi:sugar-specific transcriptional regulator TrmB